MPSFATRRLPTFFFRTRQSQIHLSSFTRSEGATSLPYRDLLIVENRRLQYVGLPLRLKYQIGT
jgi:hypothetical protein